MSQATIKKSKKYTATNKSVILSGVHMYYLSHLDGGKAKYGTKGDDLMEREYSVQILINKDIKKTLKSLHKKLSVKELSAKEFESKLGCKPPFEAEEYLTITISNNAGYVDKKTKEIKGLSAPVVKDSTKKDLAEIGIANGALGAIGVQITDYSHDKFGSGTSLNFRQVILKEYEEYVATSEDEFADDDFDFEEGDFAEMEESSEPTPESQADDDWS